MNSTYKIFVNAQENVGVIIQCDMSLGLIRRSRSAADPEVPVLSIVADESMAPFREKSADLVVSSLSAHWINDLPKWFLFVFLRWNGYHKNVLTTNSIINLYISSTLTLLS